jgi:hypothetical protein
MHGDVDRPPYPDYRIAADPRTLTLARARELADPVMSHWAERRERALVR